MTLHQGDCISLPAVEPSLALPLDPAVDPSGDQLYQVVSVDAPGDRCWLRRWPLARHGSPVFELSLRQLQGRQPHRQAHRCSLHGRS
ncbi:hypothetical protein NZK33_12640 [Cyanobium sp. FGCU-6]|nr:hypothetical protein [Cyanobium sp. FGCU6]